MTSNHVQGFGDPFKAMGDVIRSNKVLNKGAKALQKGTKTFTHVVVKTADAVHLTTAFKMTSHGVAVFGRKAGITKSVQVLRRQFFREYAGMDIPELDEEEDLADADDAVILKDDELEVEDRFFEKAFDAVAWEVTFMKNLGNEDLLVIKAHLEVQEVTRRRQHDLVAMTLKKRVLLRHEEFVDAVNEVMKVLHNLHTTAEACVAAKMKLQEAKHTIAVRGLMVPKLDRRRQRLQAVASLADAMKQFIGRYTKVVRHLEDFEFSEAVQIMQETSANALPPKLFELKAMDHIITKWKELHSPDVLIRYVQRYVDGCFNDFNESKYIIVLEGVRKSYNYHLAERTRQRIGERLAEQMVGIVRKALTSVSTIKDMDEPIHKIAEGIDHQTIVAFMCTMNMRMLDYFRVFNNVVKAHEHFIARTRADMSWNEALQGEDPTSDSSTIKFHEKCLQSLKTSFRDSDLPSLLAVILSHAPLAKAERKVRFHIFQMALMVVEASSMFLVGTPEKQKIHHGRRQSVEVSSPTTSQITSPTGSAQFLITKESLYAPINNIALGMLKRVDLVSEAANMVLSIVSDPLVPTPEDKDAVLRGPMVKSMSFRLFNEESARMKEYVEAPVAPQENPFLNYMTPANTIEYFGDEHGPVLSPRGSAKPKPVYFPLITFQESPLCDPHRSAFTRSSARFSPFMTTLVFEVIVRMPTIADGVLQMFAQLAGLYMFILSDSLVRFSKDHLMMEDRLLSPEARSVLKRIYDTEITERITSRDANSQFPPFIFDRQRWEAFSKESEMFALPNRLTAFESSASVMSLHEAFVESISGLLTKQQLQFHQQQVAQLKNTANELLELGCHIACTAIMQSTLTSLLTTLGTTKFDHSGSSFIKKFMDMYKKNNHPYIVKSMERSPTKYSQDVFWARLYFTLLYTVTKALAPCRTRFGEKNFSNCLTDVLELQDQFKALVPRSSLLIFDQYVPALLNTYRMDEETRWQWIKANHMHYHAFDLVQWFGGPKEAILGTDFLRMQKRLETELGRDLTEDGQLILASTAIEKSSRQANGRR